MEGLHMCCIVQYMRLYLHFFMYECNRALPYFSNILFIITAWYVSNGIW